MNALGRWPRRIWYFLNRRRLERELEREMASHRAMMAEPRDFGSTLRLRELCAAGRKPEEEAVRRQYAAIAAAVGGGHIQHQVFDAPFDQARGSLSRQEWRHRRIILGEFSGLVGLRADHHRSCA